MKVGAKLPECSVRDGPGRLDSLQHLLPHAEGCPSEGATKE